MTPLTQLVPDVELFERAEARMASHMAVGDTSSPEFLQAFRVHEQVKNRWGGMPPTNYLEDAHREIRAVAQ